METLVQALNRGADAWWLYVLHATWQSALVAAVALALVLVFRRVPRLGGMGCCYWLW